MSIPVRNKMLEKGSGSKRRGESKLGSRTIVLDMHRRTSSGVGRFTATIDFPSSQQASESSSSAENSNSNDESRAANDP